MVDPNSKRQKLFDKELIEKLLKEKNSYSEILEECGLPRNGGNCFTTLKNNIKIWNLDLTDFEEKQKNLRSQIVKKANKARSYSFEEIFCYNSKANLSGNNLKDRLYKEGIKKRECEECGQGEEWRGKKMSLILDHINGDRVDGRIENLKLYCPNCNSTLDTHCGKNRTRESNIKKENPKLKIQKEKLELEEKIKQEKINKIKTSGIDFSQWGWTKEVAKLLNCTPQYSIQWMKKNIFEFYKEKCKKPK